MVLSTLHTNDAASSIARLKDMGIEPYLLASSLTGIVAQRLVRKVCPFCGRDDQPTESEQAYLGVPVDHVRRATGCRQCGFTGYHGRIAIHEILRVDPVLRDMIADGSSTEEIKKYARSQGMQLLKESGVELICQEITTVEEVAKVAYYS